MYKTLPDKIDIIRIEKEILQFWSKNRIFEKSVESRYADKSFVFYEGPPTANGKPGIHHVMARAIKDLVCRYKTLRGFQVHRKAGWDTQGLPVEIEVEKSLGFKHKEEIQKYGIEKFNQACKESVFIYLKDWIELTERMGYWINLDNAYVTYTNEYIESVWWSLKKFFDDGLIYKGYKIQPYCPRCETPLSSHEVAQGYEDVKDPSVYVVFKIKDGQDFDGYQFLVWTTTPWTLISNVALCVGPEIIYSKIKFKDTGEKVILAKERLPVISHEYAYEGEIKGSELENLEYEQLLTYIKPKTKAFFVCLGDFVSTEDGSGIVHIAPAFGEDDYQLSRKYNLPVVQPVNAQGEFTDEVTDFKDRFVKDADEDIIKKLKSESKLYKKEKIVHSYPHCWRCHTPLLYYARESWYINTSSYKELMIEKNNEINWCPQETGSGRFGNWLQENRDWALSRDRYWGTPFPVWVCECDDCENKYQAVGSIDELKSLAINFSEVYPTDDSLDLHKPFIDKVKIKCKKCNCTMTRIDEVIDAWYDSGSMPFAQFHFPFENKERFEKDYPADFIAEGVDQTRGWFYSLHAIGTFLFKDKAFKNIIVNDLILDKDGQKMSKHKGNVVDPFMIMEKYGADILRWYLISSSPPWRPKMFNENDLLEIRNKFFDTLINTYRFFVLYSNLIRYEIKPGYKRIPYMERNEIDRWIISSLNTLKLSYLELMDNYDITRAARIISDFTIDNLSNWYIRRNRRRFRNPANERDKLSAYQTLYEVITEIVKMIAPVSPFLSEEIFKNLTGEESVHLTYFELSLQNEIDTVLEEQMSLAQKIVYLVRAIRFRHNLKTRQPLKQILLPTSMFSDVEKAGIEKMKIIILEEVNVKELNFIDDESGIINKRAKPNFKILGPKYGKAMKDVAGVIKNLNHSQITEIEKNNSLNVKSNGKDYEILRNDVEVYTEDIEGWIVESDENITVALDVKLDDKLIEEGLAREFINKVQNLRKELELDINDKINIIYRCEDELQKAISNQHSYISEEIVAEELKFSVNDNSGDKREININGKLCKISIKKIN